MPADGARFYKLGIIGWPLGYSLSPKMHAAALKAAGLQGEYKEYKVKPEELKNWLAVEAPKLEGFNVTMPHKEAVFEWVKENGGFLDPLYLEAIGAVNTVRVKDRKLWGFNTDGVGFMQPLFVPPDPIGKVGDGVIILLGAGGAAQAVAVELTAQSPGTNARLVIWNRHVERARELANRVDRFLAADLSMSLEETHFAEPKEDSRDLPVAECLMLINATPVGMKEKEEWLIDPTRLHEGQIVYDIVYEPRETKLIREARKRGCRVITGDEMLAGQGAESFRIWTGKDKALDGTPILSIMKKTLDEHFAARA